MKKALILSADDFEDLELMVPLYRLRETGLKVEVAAARRGTIVGIHGYSVPVDLTFAEVNADTYDLLVLPGGKAPASIRLLAEPQAIARSFMVADRPVGAICHGPQTLVSAGLLKGRHATCYRSVRGELVDAGVLYEDSEVVVDGKLVTSRQPSDLPAFMRELVRLIPAA